jgi:UDP-N-acetylmuramoyl-L-alanyl-D-glutamate--2,6-diaminopimelate ligase
MEVVSTFQGLSCRLETPGGNLSIRSNLIGSYHVYNLMAAVAAGTALELPPEVVKEGLESLPGVPGRLEKVENRDGIHILVDYAHTPDALERSLKSLTAILKEDHGREVDRKEKIITVFGCGGDRDRTKRPLMGEAAATWSDLVILTSDNPRTEDPFAILDEAEEGIQRIGLEKWTADPPPGWRDSKGYLKVVDRREAIRKAVRLARPSDIVLIAGKGHEDYQIVGTVKHPFDDRIEARRGLEEM